MSNLRPDGHHTITPSFVVPNAAQVVGFLERAFGAQVVDRYDRPDGALMHAELQIGDSVVMCAEPSDGHSAMPATLSLYVAGGKAVDAAYARALETGATSLSKPADQLWGYRSACVKDPGGNRWTICAITEVLSREELHRRMSQGT